METDKSLEILRASYPDASLDTLLEVLVTCGGSIERSVELLGGGKVEAGVSSNTRKKRPIKTELTQVLRPMKRSKGNNGAISLHTKKEIEETIPHVRVFRNFLPEKEANDLLESLVSKKMMFQDKEFYIAGRLCRSSQKSVVFTVPKYKEMNSMYSSNKIKNIDFFPELYMAKGYVDAKVNEVLNQQEVKHPFQIQGEWDTDYCVGNYFPNNKSHLDWHSDKLTNIGPLPVIASLSFGATRIFRMRSVDSGDSTIFNIILPNNTLLIMMPGAQELYKHCVPTLANSLVARNPITNEGRFSLTYRMMHPVLYSNPVKCDKCADQMILRRIASNGLYMWMCFSSFRGGNCQRRRFANFDKINDPNIKGQDLVSDTKSNCSKWTE